MRVGGEENEILGGPPWGLGYREGGEIAGVCRGLGGSQRGRRCEEEKEDGERDGGEKHGSVELWLPGTMGKFKRYEEKNEWVNGNLSLFRQIKPF